MRRKPRGVLTREKAETLDGVEVWYLISVMAVAMSTTTIISIATRDIKRYGSRIQGVNWNQRLAGVRPPPGAVSRLWKLAGREGPT